MSSDDIEFESESTEVMQDNTDETTRDDDQSSTSQQALKQLNQLTSNNSTNTVSKIATATVASTSAATTSGLQKIEPKLTMPKINNAKIVYIAKNANGTPQSIRIGGQLIGGNQSVSGSNANSTANSSSPAIQKVQLLQLKNKNVVSSAGAASASNPRFVLKSGTAPQKFIISSSGGATKLNTGAGTTTTRTITVSQAQQMGLIMPSNKTIASTASTSSTSSSTTTKTIILPTTSATGALKNQPTILNKGVKPIHSSKILIQSDGSGDATESKVKSVNAPIVRVLQGKQLQYVRVLNPIPSGNANNTTTKIVNGRQQQVIVQRKIVPQQDGQIAAGGKPQQFVTKKLEVMPIGSTTKIVKKETTTQAPVKAPATYLLNNVQKSVVTSSIDIKPATPNQSDSYEITETKEEPLSPSSAPRKFAVSRTYSLSTDRKSKSPEPNQSNLMYSTLRLPSPEPIEGTYNPALCII